MLRFLLVNKISKIKHALDWCVYLRSLPARDGACVLTWAPDYSSSGTSMMSSVPKERGVTAGLSRISSCSRKRPLRRDRIPLIAATKRFESRLIKARTADKMTVGAGDLSADKKCSVGA